MDLVDKVAELLKDKKASRKSLSEFTGIPAPHLSDMLNRKGRYLDAEHIPKISTFFGVSTDFLYGFTEKKVKTIPLIGLASCGIPNMAFNEDIEHIPVSSDIARDGVYAVTADGESMLPKISDGDIVICDKEMECEKGNIVHYTTIDGDSGLKKYLIDDNGVVTLMPLNSDFQPIMCDVKDLRCSRAFKIQSDL